MSLDDQVEDCYRGARSQDTTIIKDRILLFAAQHSQIRKELLVAIDRQYTSAHLEKKNEPEPKTYSWHKKIFEVLIDLISIKPLQPRRAMTFGLIAVCGVALLSIGTNNFISNGNAVYSDLAALGTSLPSDVWLERSVSKSIFEFSAEEPAQESMRLGMLMAQASQGFGSESERYFARLSSYLSFVKEVDNYKYVTDLADTFGRNPQGVEAFIADVLKNDKDVFIGYWITIVDTLVLEGDSSTVSTLIDMLPQLEVAIEPYVSKEELQRLMEILDSQQIDEIRKWLNFF